MVTVFLCLLNALVHRTHPLSSPKNLGEIQVPIYRTQGDSVKHSRQKSSFKQQINGRFLGKCVKTSVWWLVQIWEICKQQDGKWFKLKLSLIETSVGKNFMITLSDDYINISDRCHSLILAFDNNIILCVTEFAALRLRGNNLPNLTCLFVHHRRYNMDF